MFVIHVYMFQSVPPLRIWFDPFTKFENPVLWVTISTWHINEGVKGLKLLADVYLM